MNLEKGFKEKEQTLREYLNEEKIDIDVVDPEGEYTKLVEMLGRKIVNIDSSKSKLGWINPVTGESSHTEKLRKRAKKAIKSRKYRKAYRLLRKVKELTLCTMNMR